MLASHQYPSWHWLLLIPALTLQTLFNTGAALIVARLGGSVADVSELIPFFLRISRYFCGVMYMVTTLPVHVPDWALKVLSLNPAAVYIALTRVALMRSYRLNSPGNQPYDAGKCSYFHQHISIAPYHLQAYCQAVVTNPQLWASAIGWGVVIFVVGIVFFWQAESKYGRG
jgi:teichoic acid transport system permease protein